VISLASSTPLGLPYPQNGDPVNIAVDIQSLAEATDTALGDTGPNPFLLMGA
jgi:hypothetical protein